MSSYSYLSQDAFCSANDYPSLFTLYNSFSKAFKNNLLSVYDCNDDWDLTWIAMV